MSDRPTMVCSHCGFRHPWDRDNFPDRSVSMCVDCSTEAKDGTKEPKVIVATIRDAIGRAIYRLGAALCGFAGRWDAGTDHYANSRGRPMTDRTLASCEVVVMAAPVERCGSPAVVRRHGGAAVCEEHADQFRREVGGGARP